MSKIRLPAKIENRHVVKIIKKSGAGQNRVPAKIIIIFVCFVETFSTFKFGILDTVAKIKACSEFWTRNKYNFGHFFMILDTRVQN